MIFIKKFVIIVIEIVAPSHYYNGPREHEKFWIIISELYDPKYS